MKLTLKNVGCLSEAVIEPADLTVFCGANNTGKTYAMYVLWSVIRRRFSYTFPLIEQLANKLKEKGEFTVSLDDIFGKYNLEQSFSDAVTQNLSNLFGAPKKLFTQAHVMVALDNDSLRRGLFHSEISTMAPTNEEENQYLRVILNKDSDNVKITLTNFNIPLEFSKELISNILIELLLVHFSTTAFLMPAERGGLNIFYPELDSSNALNIALIRRIKRDYLEQSFLSNNIVVVQYAEPIQDYLNFLRKLPRLEKGETEFHDIAEGLQQDITQVSYHIADDGTITIKPLGSKVDLGIHLTSSTVKNFFGLWAYLETIAKSGDCLMIDEPELNLHPDNQRLIARLLVRLVNRGIKVVISTHSDYIVREINNMIMLGNDFQNRGQMEKIWGYDLAGSERLRVEQVAAYHFEEKQVLKIPISPEYGMEVTSMDNAINRMNQSNSDIYFALQDAIHPVITPEFVAE